MILAHFADLTKLLLMVCTSLHCKVFFSVQDNVCYSPKACNVFLELLGGNPGQHTSVFVGLKTVVLVLGQ